MTSRCPAESLSESCTAGRVALVPENSGSLPGVHGAFRATGGLAAETGVSARLHQRSESSRVVGLPRVTSMAFVPRYWPPRLASDRAPLSLKTGSHSPRDLHASFEDMTGPRGPFAPFFAHRPRPMRASRSVRTSSHRVLKDRPSTAQRVRRPLQGGLPRRSSRRHEDATPRARAALAVSHDFDGLLQPTPCRSVAPCSRSWGSPRFRSARPGCSPPRVAALRFASRARSPSPWRHTLRSLPLDRSSAPRHRDRYPRVVAAGAASLAPHVAMQCQLAFTRQPDLRVLFRCRVRCCRQVLPPDSRPLLPWASFPPGAWLSATPAWTGVQGRKIVSSQR
jgi:hypothetical protein